MSETATQLSSDAAFDADALRERYRIEREKRLRADGNEQYVEMTGAYAKYLEDPYVTKRIERAAVTDEVDVVLIGGGFGGLQAGARLRDAGVNDIRIIEKGCDFGGTWYWNRYPGAQCDIESYCYLPLLEELGYVPKEKYSYAREILSHSANIGNHFNLYEGALFQTEVTGLTWDDASARWIVSTNRGDAIKARFVSMANGPLHRPKLPGIPGIRTFKGHTFHTSRWDYDYTGGGPDGGLDKLHDKRVAIIGTGATAIQCVPFLGETAKRSTWYSARRHRSTCAAIRPPIRSGRRACKRAGRKRAWRISTRWCLAFHRSAIWSLTAGPTSSGRSSISSARPMAIRT